MSSPRFPTLTRLGLALGLVSTVAIVVAVVGINRLHTLNERFNSVIDGDAERVRLAAGIRHKLLTITRAEKSIILAKTTDEMREVEDLLESERQVMRQRLTALSDLADAEGKEIIAQFKDRWEEWLELNSQIIELTYRSENAEARELSSTAGRQLATECESLLTAIIDKNDRDMTADRHLTDERYRETRTYMILFPLVGLSITLLLSTSIVRNFINTVKKTEQAESNFRQLAENIEEVFWLTDANTRQVIYVSPSYESIWGRSSSDLYSDPLAWIRAIHNDDRATVESALTQMDGTNSFELLYRIVNSDGTIRWIQDRRFPICDADGKLIRIAGVAEDVTQSEADKACIIEKNRDLETMLYVTSHDLREPLRAIQNFSRMVLAECADRLDEEGQDYLRRVVRAADRMDGLIEDILQLSRAQRFEQPTAEIKGSQIVSEAIERLEDTILAREAQVKVVEPLPDLRADKLWATQAIYNLIANGLKFTTDNKPPDIEIGPYCMANNHNESDTTSEVGLVVRDRGPGVAPELSERIFALFQRAVERKVPGTGAGLAIVQQVAQRHGGRAWVQPRPGGGSEFFITFSKA